MSGNNVAPVLHKLARNPGTIGDGVHGVAADLERAVFLARGKEWELEHGKFADEFGIGVTGGIAGLGFFGHQLDVFVVSDIHGSSQYPQVCALDVYVESPFQFRKLAFGKILEINGKQGIDGHPVILGKGYQGVDARFSNTVLIPAEGGTFHAQCSRHIILRADLTLA